mgnify:CR=1 FL=1
MIAYKYTGPQGGLILQQKMNWLQGQTIADLYYVHGTGRGPSEVHSSGISPAFSTEYLVDNNGAPIHGGRMVFSFGVCAGNGLPANAQKPPAVGVLWGFNGHCYVFRVPAGSNYWSQNGTLNQGQEVAFPYIVESTDITQYWAPSGNFISQGGPNNPRTNFQKVAWAAYLASRVQALQAI